MKKLLPIVILLSVLSSCQPEDSLYTFVNPFIGTGGHGHTFPGPTVPFGMVQLSPDTRLNGWDGCGGYHYSDSVIYGFSHTHLSGTGVSDYGDIIFAPTTGEIVYHNGSNQTTGYSSIFSHSKEIAEAGFYQVFLEDYQIDVSLTTTHRAGFHKYIFPKSNQSNIIIDLEHRDEVLESEIEIIGHNELVGFRRSNSWATDQHIYFVAQFSKDFNKAEISRAGVIIDTKKANHKMLKASVSFNTDANEEILVRVGISPVSVASARKNLEQEINHWDFNKTRNQAQDLWNRKLSKIKIESDPKTKEIFYTSLYHSCIAPNLFMDVDGSYRGTDLKVHQTSEFVNYTVFSLWDTYRSTHPLFTLIDQEKTLDFIHTFLNQYDKGGQLPVWELAGSYTGCMIGYHSIPVIVDAYMKGIRDFDVNKAYEAMVNSADQKHLGLESYQNDGFISANLETESVSKTLEYAYDDWCIAQMAKKIGKDADYRRFIKRAQSYKNIFDPNTGFMRAKMNHSWFSPFDPAEVNFNYTEANSWQYSFYVPHDIQGLANYLGGKDSLDAKLDDLFTSPSKIFGRHQIDITGLIGQYAHGNEPSHHMAYLYNFVNRPWKTQERVSEILNNLYTTFPDGLSGNEDCGQMSSWYVLSAMGFYSVTPGMDYYVIGSPRLEQVILSFENNRTFKITAKGASKENPYIQSALLNGKDFNRSYILHNEIMNGGQLDFIMGSTPNKYWASQNNQIPKSSINKEVIVSVPYIHKGKRTFSESNFIELKTWDSDAKIFYSFNEFANKNSFQLYTSPLLIYESTQLKAISVKDNVMSNEIHAEFTKTPKDYSIELLTPYGPEYSAGGDNALIDYLKGPKSYMTGRWQGYEGVNLEVIIDLGKKNEISTLSTGFLQDWNAWIFMPEWVDYFASNDGLNFNKLGRVLNSVNEKEEDVILHDFILPVNTKTRFLKVIAKNRTFNPYWHRAPGDTCWIFADEIEIK